MQGDIFNKIIPVLLFSGINLKMRFKHAEYFWMYKKNTILDA